MAAHRLFVPGARSLNAVAVLEGVGGKQPNEERAKFFIQRNARVWRTAAGRVKHTQLMKPGRDFQIIKVGIVKVALSQEFDVGAIDLKGKAGVAFVFKDDDDTIRTG